jgi:hypothetical protein
MLAQEYKLKSDCFAVLSENGIRFSVSIPKDALVIVIAGPLDGVRMVEVSWEEKRYLLFTEDLRREGTLISSKPSTVETVL